MTELLNLLSIRSKENTNTFHTIQANVEDFQGLAVTLVFNASFGRFSVIAVVYFFFFFSFLIKLWCLFVDGNFIFDSGVV